MSSSRRNISIFIKPLEDYHASAMKYFEKFQEHLRDKRNIEEVKNNLRDLRTGLDKIGALLTNPPTSNLNTGSPTNVSNDMFVKFASEIKKYSDLANYGFENLQEHLSGKKNLKNVSNNINALKNSLDDIATYTNDSLLGSRPVSNVFNGNKNKKTKGGNKRRFITRKTKALRK